MRNGRRKTLEWFYRLVDAAGATYEADLARGSVTVTAANGRTTTFSGFDLEKLTRNAMRRRLERLVAP